MPLLVRRGVVDLSAFGAIVVAGLVAYGAVGSLEFVLYDDDRYVVDNAMVQAGLSWDGLLWALTTFDLSNWHPVTWLSLMLDVQLFGGGPAPFHWVNLAFHLCAASLLYLLLRRTTGGWVSSLVVALLFAVHPLHVESVAWVSERKDVLSTTLLLTTLLLYVSYVRRPAPSRFLLCLVGFAMGLATKPMLVTLPILLILFDSWPLARLPTCRAVRAKGAARMVLRRRLLEKIPFALLATASGVVTVWAQSSGGAVESLEEVPLWLRIGNAFASVGTYLWKTAWPIEMAIPYPHPGGTLAWWRISVGVAVVVGGCVCVLRPRTEAYLRVGWTWFLVALLPVLGLLQVGVQGMADRYTYSPHLGLFIAVVWSAAAWSPRLGRHHRIYVGVAAAILISLLVVQTRQQVAIWRTTETLFLNALSVTEANYIAHEKIGVIRATAGDMAAAEEHFRAALEFNPTFGSAHLKLGEILLREGETRSAMEHFEKAASRRGGAADAHERLAVAHGRLGNQEASITHYRAAIALEPLHIAANYNLGVLLGQSGALHEAVQHFRATIAASPDDAMAHNNLGYALMQLGDAQAAVPILRRAVELDPGLKQARGNLARALELTKTPSP